MQQRIEDQDRRIIRLEESFKRVDDKLDVGIEQREELKATLREMNEHLRTLNGRTRKSEEAIAELKFGHSTLFAELTRAIATQPDGSVQIVTPRQPAPLTKGQKVAATGLGATALVGFIELAQRAFDLATMLLKR